MKKTLCLVHPQMPWQYDHFSDPPLGLLSVAAAIREKRVSDLEVLFADMGVSSHVPKADIYAMGGTTLEFPVLNRMAGKIRAEHPGSKLILGGVHVDVFPAEYWQREITRSPFDIICKGEGEATIVKAVEAVDAERTNVVITQDQLLDLENLPFPAYDLLDTNRYFREGITFSNSNMDNGMRSATAMFTRGCPFSCTFCASPTLHHNRLRFRSEELVIKELLHMRDTYGIGALRIQDDNITFTLNRLNGLGDFLRENGFRSRGSLRVDGKSCTEETLDQLWSYGFRELGFGIEAVEQEVLDLNEKKTTVEQGEAAIKLARDKGFLVRAFLMSGLPGEKPDSGRKVADWVNRNYLYLNAVTLTNFIPLPGTEIYRNPEKFGIRILNRGWEGYNIAITRERHEFPFVHEIKGMTREQMTDNLELAKAAVFNRNLSNVKVYNSAYTGARYVPQSQAIK